MNHRQNGMKGRWPCKPVKTVWLYLLQSAIYIAVSAVFFIPAAHSAGGDILGQYTHILGGKQEAFASAVAPDGTMVIAGFTKPTLNDSEDFYTIKIDADGSTLLWATPAFIAVSSGTNYEIAIDTEDNAIVTGSVFNGTNHDFHTIKFDGATGAILWQHTFNGIEKGNDHSAAIGLDSLNNIYIGGYTKGSNGLDDFVIIKYNSSGPIGGRPTWQRTYDNPVEHGNDRINSLHVNATNGYIAATGETTVGTDLAILTVKYDINGNFIWSAMHNGGFGDDQGIVARLDDAGNVIVAGLVYNGSNNDIYTIKYSGNGTTPTIAWVKTYDGGGNDEPRDMVIDAGNAYLTGTSWTISGFSDFFTAMYAGTNGNIIWSKTYNTLSVDPDNSTNINSNTDIAVSLDVNHISVFVTGYMHKHFEDDDDFLTIKYKKDNGNLIWAQPFDDGLGKDDKSVGIGHAANGALYLAGWTDKTFVLSTGSATGGSRTSLIDTSKNWPDLSGYQLIITSGLNNGLKRLIISNTANQVTWDTAIPVTVSSGDSYEIKDPDNYDFKAVKYDQGLLNTPTDLTASLVTENEVKLDWTINSDGEEGFHIFRKICNDQFYPDSPHDSVGPGISVYNDIISVIAHTKYCYQVLAFDDTSADYSHFSNEASITTTDNLNYDPPNWSYIYQGPTGSDDVANGVAVGPDFNPVITGYSFIGDIVSGSFDYLTIKLNYTDASVIWSQSYDDPDGEIDEAQCLTVDQNNDVIVSGYASLYNISNTLDLMTIKYYANFNNLNRGVDYGGNPKWYAQYDGPDNGDDRVTAISSSVDGSNNIVVIGYGNNLTGDDIYILKYVSEPTVEPTDPRATAAWQTVFNNTSANDDDRPSAVAIDYNNDILVTGLTFNGTDDDIFIGKYDADTGNEIWTVIFDSTFGDDKGRDITVDSDNNIYITGYVSTLTKGKDIYVAKYCGSSDPETRCGAGLAQGELIWSDSYNGNASGDDTGATVRIDLNGDDDNVVVAGTILYSLDNEEFYVARYSSTGMKIWSRTLDRGATRDHVVAMVMDVSGDICVAGNTDDSGSSDIMAILYDHEGQVMGTTLFDGVSSNDDESLSMAVSRLGHFYVAGYTTTSNDDYDYILMRCRGDILQSPSPFTNAAYYIHIDFNWVNNAPDADGYRMRRQVRNCADANLPENQGDWAWVNDNLPVLQTSITDTGLNPETTYCYQIQSYKDTIGSRWLEKTISTVHPPAPEPFTARAADTTTVALAWEDNLNGEDSFIVQRCDQSLFDCVNPVPHLTDPTDPPASRYETLDALPAGTTSYIDNTACEGKTYTYRIQGHLDGLWDSYFAYDADVLIPAKQTPDLLSAATFSESRIDLDWNNSNIDQTGFKIYRCDATLNVNCTPNILAYTVTETPPPADTVLFMHLDEQSWHGYAGEVKDSTANNHHGKAVGSANTIADGHAGRAGSTSPGNYIQVGDPPGLRLYSGNAFSLEAWFRPSVDVTAMKNTYPLFIFKRNWLVGGYGGHFTKSTGTVNVQYCWSGGALTATSTSSFTAGNWYHYLATYDGSTLKLYINGVLEASQNATQPMASSAGYNLTIGNGFEGDIDEAGIYNRALTQEEVTGRFSYNVERFPTRYSDKPISPNTSYRYHVEAFKTAPESCDGGWTSAASNILSAPTGDILDPLAGYVPDNLIVTTNVDHSTSQIDISWSDNTELEDGFVLERCVGVCTSSSFPVDDSFTVNADLEAYQDLSVCPNTTYTYRIKAERTTPPITWETAYSDFYNTDSTSMWSSPTSLVGSFLSEERIRLTWSDNTIDETGFEIERCEGTACDFSSTVTLSAPASAGTGMVAYDDTRLTPGTTYNYRVRAVKSTSTCTGANAWPTGYSNSDEISTDFIYAGTINLTQTPLTTTEINLSWTDKTSNETGFVIERCDPPSTCTLDTDFTAIDTVAPYDKLVSLRMDEASWTGASNEVLDTSGKGFHGTAVGGATTTDTAHSGRAGAFGPGMHVNLGDDEDLQLHDKNAFTLEGWIKPDVDVKAMASDWPYFIFKRPWGVGGYGMFFNSLSTHADYGRLYVQYCWEGACFDIRTDKTDFVADTWYHLAGTFDGTYLKLYINGQLVKTSAAATKSMAASPGYDLTIGNEFEGSIDEVVIYDRALSYEEIIRRFNDTEHSYTDSTVCNATTYKYRVKAIDQEFQNGFNGCWDKRAQVFINSHTPNTVVELSVLLADYAGMQADFDDIRFYQFTGASESDGQVLSHYITKRSATKADIFLKTSGTSDHIYMYFGNDKATDSSDADSVFEFYDDFSGKTINSNKWQENDNDYNEITQNDTLLHTNIDYPAASLISKVNFDRDIDRMLYVKSTTFSGSWQAGWVNTNKTTTASLGDFPHALQIQSGNSLDRIYEMGTSLGYGNQSRNSSGYEYETKIVSSASGGARYYTRSGGGTYVYPAWHLIMDTTANNPLRQNSPIHVGFVAQTSQGTTFSASFIGVTPYSDTSVTVGAPDAVPCDSLPHIWNGVYSNEVAAEAPAPVAPDNFYGTALSESEIELLWTDNTKDETGFKVYRCEGTGGDCDEDIEFGPVDTLKSKVLIPPPTDQSVLLHFDGNWTESIKGLNSTRYGGVNFGAGYVGQAANFDGIDDKFRLDTSFKLSRYGATLTWWMKAGNTSNTGLFSQRYESSTESHIRSISNGIYGETDTNCNNFNFLGVSKTTSWTMYTIVFENERAYLYVNGEFVKEADDYGAVSCSGSSAGKLVDDLTLQYFGMNNAYDPFYKGLLDEVQFFGRSLSSSEIRTIFDSSPFVMKLDFNEASWNGLSGEVKDSSGKANHGTSYFALNPVEEARNGHAASFNGTDQYIVIPSSSTLENATDSSHTFAAWVKPLSAPAGLDVPVPPMHGNDTRAAILVRPGYHMGLTYAPNKKFYFNVWNSTNVQFGAATQNIFEPGAWHYVVGVTDDSRKMAYIYVDGELEGSVNYSGTLRDYGTTHYKVGAAYAASEQPVWQWYFHGLIDEPAIYVKALTLAEVREVYASYLYDPDLRFNTPYTYRVQAFKDAFCPWKTMPPTETVVSTLNPPQPTNLRAVTANTTHINLNWEDNTGSNTAFEIQRSPFGSTDWEDIATLGPDVTTYADQKVCKSSDYTYRIRAISEVYEETLVFAKANGNGWTRRAPLQVLNFVSDFQTRLVIPYDSKMKSDFSDLRIYDATAGQEQVLGHWIESKTNGQFAVIWFRIGTNSDNLYLYYGNPDATSTSNGDAVFEFFDNFNDNSINAGKWSYSDHPNSLVTAETGGLLRRSGATTNSVNGWSTLRTVSSFNNYRVTEFNFRVSQHDNAEDKWNFGNSLHIRRVGSGLWQWQYYDVSFVHLANSNYTTGPDFMKVKLVRDTGGISIFENDNFIIKDTRPIGAGTSTEMAYVSQARYNYTSVNDLDDFRVRKYASTEPTVNILAAESPVVYWNTLWADLQNPPVSTPEVTSPIFETLHLTNAGDSGWEFKKKLTITNFQSDYQTKVIIDYDPDMLPDFADLRFFDETSKTELPLWIESKTDGSTATVWFTTGANNNISLYYGNKSATSISDPKSVFEFFEDFEYADQSAMDAAGWTPYGAGYVALDNSVAYSGAGSGHKVTSDDPNGAFIDMGKNVGRNVRIEFWLRRNSLSTGNLIDRLGLMDAAGNGYNWFYRHSSTVQIGVDRRDAYNLSSLVVYSSANYQDNWVRGVLKPGPAADTFTAELYRPGNILYRTVNSPADATHSSFSRFFIGGGHDYWVDDVIVRKYAATEPAVALGDETASGAATLWKSETRINLIWEWNDQTSDETSFEVERCIDSGSGCSSWVNDGPPISRPANTVSFSATGLLENTTYCYRLRARKSVPGGCNDGWYSEYNAFNPADHCLTTSVRVPELTLPPQAVPDNTTQIRLNWQETIETEKGYRFWRCPSDSNDSCPDPVNGIYALLPTTAGANVISWIDDSVCSRNTYHYKVQAYTNDPETTLLTNGGGGTWSRRKPLSISPFYANHQIKVVVSYDSDMKNDFSDIRFYDEYAETELPFWIEEKTNGVSAVFWIKTGENNNISLYYANASASVAASVPTAVFQAYSSGFLNGTLTHPTNPGGVFYNTDGFVIEANVRFNHNQGGPRIKFDITGQQNTTIGCAWSWTRIDYDSEGREQINVSTAQNGLPTGSWREVVLKVKDSTFNVYLDGSHKNFGGNNFNLPWTTGTISFSSWNSTTGYQAEYNHVFVRNYVANDSVVSLGAEELTAVRAWTSDMTNYQYGSATANTWHVPQIDQVNTSKSTESTIKVSWTDNDNTDESFHKIYRGNAACLEASFQWIGDTAGPDHAAFIDDGSVLQPAVGVVVLGELPVNADFCYRVTAYKTAPCSWESDPSGNATASTAVDPPQNLQAIKVDSTQIDLSWDDMTTLESGFEVFRCQGTESECTLDTQFNSIDNTLPPHTGTTKITYRDSNICPGLPYTYKVRAFRSGQWGETSGEGLSLSATATTDASYLPTALALTEVYDAFRNQRHINLNWSDINKDETGFRVERCEETTTINCLDPSHYSEIDTIAFSINDTFDTAIDSNIWKQTGMLHRNTVTIAPINMNNDSGQAKIYLDDIKKVAVLHTVSNDKKDATYNMTRMELNDPLLLGTGNFDLSFDYNLPAGLLWQPEQQPIYLQFEIAFGDNNSLVMKQVQTGYTAAITIAGNTEKAVDFATVQTSGKIRVTRVDNAITGYFRINNQWQKMLTHTQLIASDAVPTAVRISQFAQRNEEHDLMLEIDNFKVDTERLKYYDLDPLLKASATYFYQVRVYKDNPVTSLEYTCFDWTFRYTDPPASEATNPAKPTTLIAAPNGSKKVKLVWNDNALDESEYRIEKMMWNGVFEQLAIAPADTTEFIDTVGLSPDTPYTYRVRAFRSSDASYSPYSNQASTTTNSHGVQWGDDTTCLPIE